MCQTRHFDIQNVKCKAEYILKNKKGSSSKLTNLAGLHLNHREQPLKTHMPTQSVRVTKKAKQICFMPKGDRTLQLSGIWTE